MSETPGRWQRGLALALLTTVLWGMLPLALKIALQGMDAYTITWYRFSAAALVLGGALAAARRLPARASLARGARLLALAAAGLTSNYVLYLVALDHTTPAVAQVVIQLGPMLLLFGGLVVFRERFSAAQWAGFALLIVGLGLFFNRRLPQLLDLSGGTGLGVALLVLAALVWAVYGLAQKQLARSLGPQQILWLLYVAAAVVLAPIASPSEIAGMSSLQLWMLAFSCANTLVAYGSFAESLQHWEVSRVSAVLAVAPLFTLAGAWLIERFAPGVLAPEGLNALSVLGALLVVGGSAICALGAASRPAPPARAAARAGGSASGGYRPGSLSGM
jgi:drug/metabolite transporter (DMT)-like permease